MNNMVRKWDEINGTEMEGSPGAEAPEDKMSGQELAAPKEILISAMTAAGYEYDIESTDDELRFYSVYGNLMRMESWKEAEDWLNGVVFDDPAVSDRVEWILHPERFGITENPMKNAEMQMEDDYDSIDGIINNGKKDKDADDKKCRSSVVEEIRMHTKEIREHTPEDRQRSICTKERAL